MNIRCLIVDDEPIARQIIENYCALLPELAVVGTCGSALEARRIIDSKTVDLIFLDINMPVLDGMSFVKTLSRPPVVIFTTAYKEFAHEAFDIAACDYLLKPFSFDRFLIAIDRAKEKLQPNQTVTSASATENFTYLKAEGKIYKINFDEVLYAEASGNNVKIVTEGGVITPAITFTALEEVLPVSTFIRIHRSFIINKNKIGRIEGNRVFVGEAELPIGASYRELFLRALGMK
jgi:DNA-binding LytR/AlgR family response regulator